MQGELVFCEVALHFVSDSLHMTPACSHGGQITMPISMYILCCCRKILYILLRCQSLCIFGRVRWMRLSGVSCSWFDPMV